MHWASGYIGKPYSAENNCWQFFRHIQEAHYNRPIPEMGELGYPSVGDTKKLFAAPKMYRGWERVVVPRDGDAILMSFSHQPHHIGTWIDVSGAKGVLHCLEKIGVVFTKEVGLNRSGWKIQSAWRYYQ